MNVEFCESDSHDVLLSVEMPMPPRVGETVSLQDNRRMKVLSVEYVVLDKGYQHDMGAICIVG